MRRGVSLEANSTQCWGKFARGGSPSVRASVFFSLNLRTDGKFGNVSVGTAERTGRKRARYRAFCQGKKIVNYLSRYCEFHETDLM